MSRQQGGLAERPPRLLLPRRAPNRDAGTDHEPGAPEAGQGGRELPTEATGVLAHVVHLPDDVGSDQSAADAAKPRHQDQHHRPRENPRHDVRGDPEKPRVLPAGVPAPTASSVRAERIQRGCQDSDQAREACVSGRSVATQGRGQCLARRES